MRFIGVIMKKIQRKGSATVVNNYECHVKLMQRNLREFGLDTKQVSEDTQQIIYCCEHLFSKEGKMFENIWED